MDRESAVRAARAASVPFFADAASRARAARDFGRLRTGECLLVAEPETAEACARLVTELRGRGIGCTVRGAGYSQSGQSVAFRTVSIGTRRLDRLGPIDRERLEVTVGAGATPRQLLAHLAASDLCPPVLPLNLDMTIGGLLSAGGVGSSSHRHGTVASNVRSVTVVSGDGVLRTASAEENPDLFDAVRGGIGRMGIIVEARLGLRPAPRRVRVASFLYEDRSAWIEDQAALSELHPGFHLEGYCWFGGRGMRATPAGPAPVVAWSYGLAVGAGDDVPKEIQERALRVVRATRRFEGYETDFQSFTRRYEPRFEGMVKDELWELPHPWFEAVIPCPNLDGFLEDFLARLPPSVGDGHRVMLVDASRCPPHFGAPPATRVAVVGVLPPGVPRATLPATLAALEPLDELVIGASGRRYLSGFLGTNAERSVSRHFAPAGDSWTASRRKYDPAGLFRSALTPGAD
ncbi:MAG TPA: FAD-binding oxidoreductase [Polyangiaceae bacterium]|nr:FAD-binding oxidoreductase [Polyangiaceae bacterium]